jgi:hypothetical protein
MHDWFWYSLLIILTAGYVYWIARFFVENACVFGGIDDDLAEMIFEASKRG